MDSFEGLRDILVKDYELAEHMVTPTTPLSDLPIDSLAMVELIFAIEDRFGVTADEADSRSLGEFATLADLAAYIDELQVRRDNAVASIAPLIPKSPADTPPTP